MPVGRLLFTMALPLVISMLVQALYNVVPVHSKGDRSWDFFGRNDAKAETPVLWPPHAKS